MPVQSSTVQTKLSLLFSSPIGDEVMVIYWNFQKKFHRLSEFSTENSKLVVISAEITTT